MKKTILTIVLSVATIAFSYGQKIHKREARKLFEETMNDLRTSDTTDFIHLWYLDNSPSFYHPAPFTSKDAKSWYNQFQLFLDTAITRNLKIDEIEIEKPDTSEIAYAKYKIRVWYKYSAHRYKGYGFLVDYVNGEWKYRFTPDTSTMGYPIIMAK